MITVANRATPPDERHALQQSEKKASERQPGSFNEQALTDKIVEIPPPGKHEAAIQGLDPKAPR